MALTLCKFDDFTEDGKLLPGYSDEKTGWVKFPGKYTQEYVNGAMMAATNAGERAALHCIEVSPKSKEGWVLDVCGLGSVKIDTRSIKLKKMLEEGGCYRFGTSGVSFFGYRTNEQALRVYEAKTDAEKNVLAKAFPNAHVYAETRID